MSKILVIGAGHQGMTMACHLAINQEEVFVWNRSFNHIEELQKKKDIYSRGVIEGKGIIREASDHIERVIQKIIMVTVPSSAHKDVAKMLAPLVDGSNIIYLHPGRTLGILEFGKVLSDNGCKELPVIVEAQTIVYTCRKSGNREVTVYAMKNNVLLAGKNSDETNLALEALPECLKKYFVAADSYLRTSFGNVGMILHCAPVLLNVGWIENNNTKFNYYYDGITPSIASVLEKMDCERMKVSEKLGIHLESVKEWMERSYHISGNTLYECLQNNIYYKKIEAPTTIHHRYLEEDIPCGLVPVEKIAEKINVETPTIKVVIDLANLILDRDLRKSGRNEAVVNLLLQDEFHAI